MEANVKQFLKQTSQSQGIFIWDYDDYKYIKGAQCGHRIGDLIVEYKWELKDALQEMYDHEDSNHHTKMIIKDIVRIHFKKKKRIN